MIISSKFNSNFSPLKLSKSEAIELAENAFKKENIALGQEWRREVRATNWSEFKKNLSGWILEEKSLMN